MPKVLKKPKQKATEQKPVEVPAICLELQKLQRYRAVVLKSRNMQSNRIQAIVAGTLGYEAKLPEKERMKKFAEAGHLINVVQQGKSDHPMKLVIQAHMVGIDTFNGQKADYEKEMVQAARQLPVMAWVKQPEQRGFGELFLAIVIGETGDLSNYANPAKLWRRLGCAPWTFDGQTWMGATWRSGKHGKLPADEWESFGYSPRRRSIAYLIGKGLQMQNYVRGGAGDGVPETESTAAGPYRARYDDTKASIKAAHPEYSDLRCHRHGMLLATKLLLKNLWVQWHGQTASIWL